MLQNIEQASTRFQCNIERRQSAFREYDILAKQILLPFAEWNIITSAITIMERPAKNPFDAVSTSRYLVRKVPRHFSFSSDWDSAAWKYAEILDVKHFRPESSSHRPKTFARLQFDSFGIYGCFKVCDRYVRSVRTRYGDPVWKDSCVEFFFQPKAGAGYFNFEFNCGGAFLACYITNPERVEGGFKEFVKIPERQGRSIKVRSSLPPIVSTEISEPIDWTLHFFIPFKLLEIYSGPFGKPNGLACRGNFFKCAEENSHPHWASWSPVDEFNFHRPQCFGEIHFEK